VKNHNTLGKDDVIGFADVLLDDYVLKYKEEQTLKLKDDKGSGSITIKKTQPVKFRLYAR